MEIKGKSTSFCGKLNGVGNIHLPVMNLREVSVSLKFSPQRVWGISLFFAQFASFRDSKPKGAGRKLSLSCGILKTLFPTI